MGSALGEPLHTVTAGGEQARPGTGNAMGLLSATLVQTGYGEREGQAPRALDLADPLGTVVSGGKHAVVSAFLAKHFTGVVGSDTREPMGTVTAVDHHSLVAASLVNVANSKSTGRGPNAWAPEEPLRTVTASPGFAVASAHLIRHFGESVGGPAEAPAPTVTAGGGGKTGLVAAHLVKMNFGDKAWSGARDPLPTILAGANHHALVKAFLVKYYGSATGADLHDSMHTVTAEDRFGLVTVEGEEYAIVDIGLRMLEPRELFRAQGFPDSYMIDRAWFGVGDRRELRPLSKSAQVRMCGNSVCPPVARAIVAVNVPELAVHQPALA